LVLTIIIIDVISLIKSGKAVWFENAVQYAWRLKKCINNCNHKAEWKRLHRRFRSRKKDNIKRDLRNEVRIENI